MDIFNSWIVAKNKPNQFNIALQNLERQGFEVFQPQLREVVRVKNKFREYVKPLFPGYFFIKINTEEKNWCKVRSTRGISNIIAFGNEIPILKCDLVEDLKSQFSLEKKREPNEHFESGMIVELRRGPFSQLWGRII